MTGAGHDGSGAQSVEFFDGMAQLWAGRWWILSACVLGTALFLGVSYLMTPIYRASTVLAPASQERAGLGGLLSSALGSFGGLASLAGISGGGPAQQSTDEAVAVLRSRQFVEKFITERNLLPKLYPKLWDDATGKWNVPPEEQPGIASAVKYFLKDVMTVTQDKKTNLLTLQIDCEDRLASADWANDLVHRLNDWMRAKSVGRTDASLAYLRKEMEGASMVEARLAIGRLMEAQINQRMLSSVSDEFSFRVLDPAYAPDRGDRARPKRLLMAIFGFLAGGVLGSAVVILRRLPRPSRPRPT